MVTLHRPAKPKVTKDAKAKLLADLKVLLTSGQRIVFLRPSPFDHPTDWVVLCSDLKSDHGEIHNISYDVAALLERQCGDSLFLRGWPYDSPRGLLHDLIKLLDLPLTLDTI